MLVLTRRVGECVLIGESIEVRVLDVDGGSVRIGIRAPRDVLVLRSEIAPSSATQKRAKEAAR